MLTFQRLSVILALLIALAPMSFAEDAAAPGVIAPTEPVAAPTATPAPAPMETLAPTPVPAVPAEPPKAEAVNEVPILMQAIEVLGTQIERNPAGRTITRVQRDEIAATDTFSLKDLLESSPGINLKQTNGPRDVSISIRGSGAKQGFGVRNMKIYEDWFPTTQSDGLSRTDLHDPNAYEGMDVMRGPSSSLYDNYAIGGVLNFRARRGRDIQGLDMGSSAGSHGYLNNTLHLGNQSQGMEYSLFGSVIKGDGFLNHSDYITATQNFNLTFTPDEKRTFHFKFLNNDLETNVPNRISLNQFDLDPRSSGLTTGTAAGSVSAEQAAQNRHDRRTIIGGRFEYAPDPLTGIRVMAAYDVKDINQTFSTVIDNVNPNFHHYIDVTREGMVFGKPAKHLAGVFYNYMEQESTNFQNMADFRGTRGRMESNTRGWHRNYGGRLREELSLTPTLNLVMGVGAENSDVNANVTTRTGAETYRRIPVDRSFFNVAPEIGLVYQATPKTKFNARAGSAYGIPGIGQLTTTAQGTPGNNSDLDAQRVVGFELGADRRGDALSVNAVGYYEFFYDEFITQAPAPGSAGTSNFTSNAPRADHRGAELWVNWKLPAGLFWSAAYTFNNHVYTEYEERFSTTTVVDRKGNKVPGVEEHIVNTKVGVESAMGLGGWVELSWVDDYFINNSNTLKAEDYTVLNLNMHYGRKLKGRVFKGVTLFFDVKNALDKLYIGSANVVADSATSTPTSLRNTAAFFAAPTRQFFGGVKLEF